VLHAGQRQAIGMGGRPLWSIRPSLVIGEN
jgi:hypothetical protein